MSRAGTPEDVVNFFCFLAEEVRQRLADLGYKSLDEIIGNTEILNIREDTGATKTANLDLGFTLQSSETPSVTSTERRSQPVHSNGELLDDEVLSRPSVKKCIEEHIDTTEKVCIPKKKELLARRKLPKVLRNGDTYISEPVNFSIPIEQVDIINTDRSFCTKIAGKIASIHGDNGFEGRLSLEVHGSAG